MPVVNYMNISMLKKGIQLGTETYENLGKTDEEIEAEQEKAKNGALLFQEKQGLDLEFVQLKAEENMLRGMSNRLSVMKNNTPEEKAAYASYNKMVESFHRRYAQLLIKMHIFKKRAAKQQQAEAGFVKRCMILYDRIRQA